MRIVLNRAAVPRLCGVNQCIDFCKGHGIWVLYKTHGFTLQPVSASTSVCIFSKISLALIHRALA